MKKELTISFYSILYGMLLLVGVFYWNKIVTLLIQIVAGWFIDFEFLPFLRIVILIITLVFALRFLHKMPIKNQNFNRIQFYNLLLVTLSGMIGWFLLASFHIHYFPLICGISLTEDWYKMAVENYSRNLALVEKMEFGVIFLSILIYSLKRINEIPEEETKLSED